MSQDVLAVPVPRYQSFRVTVILSESGAAQLRHDTGRNWMEDMQLEETVEGYGTTERERLQDAEREAEALFGRVVSICSVPESKPFALPLGVLQAEGCLPFLPRRA